MTKFLSFAAAAAFAVSAASGASAAIDGTMEGAGARSDSAEVVFGTILNFGPTLFTFGTAGEYAGANLTSVSSLEFNAGAVNNGLQFTADLGGSEILFEITNSVVAELIDNGPAVADGWSLAGEFAVSSTDAVLDAALSDTASFSLAGTNVNSSAYTFFIQTPPQNFTPTTPVPLPAGMLLLGTAVAALGVSRRRA